MGMKPIKIPFLFVGGGAMARAIIVGAERAGVLDLGLVGVVEPDAGRRGAFLNGFETAQEGIGWLGGLGVECGGGRGGGIVLAVKPQVLGEATVGMRGMIEELGLSPVVISILAGTRSERVEEVIGGRVVRVMPNTPVAIGMGMSAVCGSGSSTEADVELVERLMGAVGDVVRIDESLMDAFTAVAGSGPAYVFYVAEAMTKAAVELGFDEEMARRIVEQTIAGSAKLLAESDDDAGRLRAKVTSKNGTTHAATATLDELGAMDAFVAALRAARDRGEELARDG